MSPDYFDEPEPPIFDSGLTEKQIDRIFAELARGVEFHGDDALSVCLAIGLLDGDVIEMSERGTVMLTTPREVIDARVAAIRTALADGLTLNQAIEAVCGDSLP